MHPIILSRERFGTIGMNLRTRWVVSRRYAHLLARFTQRWLDFSSVRCRFYEAYWRHAAGALGAEIIPLGGQWYEISLGGRVTRVRYHYVNIDTYFNKLLADDKVFVSKEVERIGFNVPRFVEYDLRSMRKAEEFLERSGGPCVVKPTSGSGGRGITTGIDSRRRLIQASLAASNSLSLSVLMFETQAPGDCYRLLYLDGRLLHAVRRGRCGVVGDGESTVAQLVAHENKRRLEATPVSSLNDLRIDLEAKYTLADQGLSLKAVPARGERIIVKNVSNQNASHDQDCATDAVHPNYHDLARALNKRFGFRLIGVDVMSTDIGAPPNEANSAINEVNIPPGLHYHEYIDSQPSFSNVGVEILKCIFD